MKRTGRMLSALLAAALLGATLSGCSGGEDSASAADSTASASTQAESAASEADSGSGEVVEINYLTWRNRPDIYPESLIEAFEAENPNIKVNYQVVKNTDEFLQAQQVRLLSGTDIDVTSVRPESMADYVEAGYLLDLTGADYLDNYMESTLGNATIDGKVYGVPGAINLIGVYYNKDMFEEYGIKVPTNWDEFIAAMEAFKAQGIYSLASGYKDGWPTEFDVYNFFHDLMIRDPDIFKKVNSGEVKYTDEIFLDTFRKIDEFYKAGYILPDCLSLTGADIDPLFIGQQIPMVINGEWGAATYDAVDLEFELGLLPLYVESTQDLYAATTVGNYECGVASTKHPEEVKKFLEFMSTQQGATITANDLTAFSPVKGVTLETDSCISMFNDMLDMPSVDFFYSQQRADDNSEMIRLLQEMFLQSITPEELAQSLQESHDANS